MRVWPLLPLALVGCTAPVVERPGRAEQPIAEGYEDVDDTAVVAIYNAPHGSLCSGALLAPNVVLTARHCVAEIVGGVVIDCGKSKFSPTWPAAGFQVTTDADAITGDYPYQVDEVRVAGDDKGFCGNDLAILILDKLVPPEVAKPYEPLIGTEIGSGDGYYAVGYGATDGSGSGAGLRRRRDDLLVSCVGAACDAQFSTTAEWVGDEGICSGDSGGPALDLQDRVAGVTSRSDPECGYPIYGYTVSWGSWLKDSVVHASGKGLYEPPAWTSGSTVDPSFSMPVGESCQVDADCPTGRCLQDGDASYCTRPCDADHFCPEGFECASRVGTEVCVEEKAKALPSFTRADRGSGCVASGRRGSGGGLPMLLLSAVLAWRRRNRSGRP